MLLEKIDTASDLEKAVGYVMTCIKKLYLLAEILKPEVVSVGQRTILPFEVKCYTKYSSELDSRLLQFSTFHRTSKIGQDFSNNLEHFTLSQRCKEI